MATTTGIVEGELVLYPEKSSLERLRFFFGQLLTQRDLEAEQSYHLRLQRLTQREAFGTGTVAGLGVTPATEVNDLSVFVNPGLAFDPDGRELILEAMECIPVAEASVPGAGGTAISGGTETEVAASVEMQFGPPFPLADLLELQTALRDCGLLDSSSSLADLVAVLNEVPLPAPPGSLVLEPPVLLRDYLFDQLVGVTFVGLRYREVGIDPAPAVLDASCCGGVSCFPTRTSQGVYIVSSNDPFPVIEDPYTGIRECIDSQFFEQMVGNSDPVNVKAALCACLTSPAAWRGLPPTDDLCGPPALPIVPLAKVCWRRFTDGTEPSILSVDNCSWRPLAPGIPAIRALIESFTSGARAGGLLPRVVEISPTENQTLLASETGASFVMRATMDSPMSSVSITSAWELVYYPDSGSATTYDSSSLAFPGGATMSSAVLTDGTTLGSGPFFELSFPDASGPFAVGTYVWRLQVSGSSLTSDANTVELDGEPNPPNAVPSGNSIPGGTFEARFVVAADPS